MLHRASHISFLTLLLFTIHFSLFTISATSSAPPSIPTIPLPSQNESDNLPEEQSIIEPPPPVKLNIRPPQNEEEAFNRIKDYKVLINIIPPGTSQEQIKKQLFGEYKELVEPYLEEEEKAEENNTDNYHFDHRGNGEPKEGSYRTQSYTQNFEEDKHSKNLKHKHQIKSLDNSKEKKTNLENKPEKNIKVNTSTYQEKSESSIPILPIISFVIISLIAILFLKILKTSGGRK